LYFKFIQSYPQLNKDTFALHHDFFLQLKEDKQIQRNTKLLFSILISIYLKVSRSTEFVNHILLSDIIQMLISLTHEVVNNKYKEEIFIFFISSINDLCENKHSSYICNYLSNSNNFIILCGNILQLKHQYYYISCIILNICFTIFNNKYLEAMLQVLNSNKASLLNKKIIYYFPFVQTLCEKQINLFKENCFYILRLLLQKEQIINYLEDYLYIITKADENINRYLEAIFYSFFYWHRKGNKRDKDKNLTYNKVKISFIQNQLFKIKSLIF
jgi:hypothetical protein